MIDTESPQDSQPALFNNAISFEDLKQDDPSASFSCERLGDGQVPSSLWQRILAWFNASSTKSQ